MDSRFEPLEQVLMNKLIIFINEFIHQHPDELLTNQSLREDVKEISKALYAFAHLPINHLEIDDTLSKKNLLSIDTVNLPVIDELALSDQDKANFRKLISNIHTNILVKRKQNGTAHFYREVQTILSMYHA